MSVAARSLDGLGRPTATRRFVRPHLKPYIGRRPLARLTPEDVAQCLEAVAAKGSGSTTVRHAYAVLHAAMARAVRSRKVVANVVDLVDKPTVAYRAIDPWTPAEVDRFLDALGGDRYAPLYAFAIGSGCRQGEILGLGGRRRHGGTEGPHRRAASRSRELVEVKTERGRRTFGLPEPRSALKAQKVLASSRSLAAGYS